MKILAPRFTVFPFTGVKNHDTNQPAFLSPPWRSSRLDLEQLLGGTYCWASPSQAWSPGEQEAEKQGESNGEERDTKWGNV